jgi:Na+-driven multidrug efflux pump
MGGVGPALQEALAYSDVWFGGAVLVWANAFLSALLRGGGDALTPGRYGLGTALAYLPLAALLALGIGAWPGLGLPGFAIASMVTTGAVVMLMIRALWRGRLGFTPSFAGVRLQRRLLVEILRVGLIASFTTFTSNVTAMIMIGLVSRFGVAALAGYGIGVRLEFMVGPIAFGIGTGLTTLVGVAAGAGAWRRAVRVAWTGALVSFVVTGLIGWTVALLPETWSRLFATDDAVVAASVSYITHVAPFYCFFGLGLCLNFASQGAGRMLAPFVAGIVRMIVVTTSGWLAVDAMGLGLGGVFGAIAIGTIVYGSLIAGSLLVAPWKGRRS